MTVSMFLICDLKKNQFLFKPIAISTNKTTMEYYEDCDYYYTEEEECDDDEVDEYYESSEESELLDHNPLINYEERAAVQWKTVTVGKTTVSVSNEGKLLSVHFLSLPEIEKSAPPIATFKYVSKKDCT